jgi:hypothetical protein
MKPDCMSLEAVPGRSYNPPEHARFNESNRSARS